MQWPDRLKHPGAWLLARDWTPRLPNAWHCLRQSSGAPKIHGQLYSCPMQRPAGFEFLQGDLGRRLFPPGVRARVRRPPVLLCLFQWRYPKGHKFWCWEIFCETAMTVATEGGYFSEKAQIHHAKMPSQSSFSFRLQQNLHCSLQFWCFHFIVSDPFLQSLFQILVCSKRLFFYMLSYILCCPVKVTSGWSKEMASFIRVSFTTRVMLTASLFMLFGQGQPPKSPLPKKSIVSDQNSGHAIVS